MYLIGKSYERMDDKEIIVKVSTILEGLVLQVKTLSDKIDDLKDGHVKETSAQLAVMNEQLNSIKEQYKRENTSERLATGEEKVKKLESTVYGLLWAAAIEGLALITAIALHFLTK